MKHGRIVKSVGTTFLFVALVTLLLAPQSTLPLGSEGAAHG